jgi:PAS domain S-box-containing protein
LVLKERRLASTFVDPDLVSAVLELGQGDHLCLLYDNDPAEQLPAILPFLRQGLMSGEQCVYVADDHTTEAFRAALADYGIDVLREEARGALILWTRDEWRQPGELDSERKAKQVRAVIEKALASGFSGVRFGVEMTWTLGPDIDVDKLRHWEATINTIFTPEVPARIICQYNRARLSPEAIQAGICTHPVAVIGSDICPNPFYEGGLVLSGDYLAARSTPEQVDMVISQLRWARAFDREREQRVRAEAVAEEAKRSQQLHEELESLAEHQRETDEALLHLGAIVASSDDAIVSKDLDGIIKSWNPGAERIFGYSAAEAIGKSIRLIIPADRQGEEEEVLRRIRSGKRVDHFETVRQRRDGSLLPISLTVSPVKDRDGRIIGASKIARDITEKKEAEEAVRRSITMKDQFLGLVSHELRTPISTIIGNGQLLLRRAERLPEEDRHQALVDIVSESERLQRIVENLLLLTRIEATGEFKSEAIELPELAKEVIGAVQKRVPKRRISFDVGDDVPRAAGDSTLVALVLHNLIGNADKYSPLDSPIAVALRRNDSDRPEIHVVDEGIGIGEEEIGKVFEPFYRSATAKVKAHGMGLGLAVCKKVVDAMGGSIRVESKADAGCDFSFSLPVFGDSAS